MKVTAIRQQVKNPSRYSIFVDGKYSFSLNETQLLENKIHVGQEFSESEVKKLKEQSDFGKLYDRTLNLISFRPRSRWEIEFYLRRKKQTPETIEKVLNKLSESGFIDDKKFAQSWVENRRLLKPTSQRKLQLELRAKRVPNDIINEVLEPDEKTELEALRQLVSKKQSRYPDRLKFMQYLARQGFNYDLIKQVLDE